MSKIIGKDKEMRWYQERGLFLISGGEERYVANFLPQVEKIRDKQGELEIELLLLFTSGRECRVFISPQKLKRMNWFELCLQCIVNEDEKEAKDFLRRYVQMQVAEYVRKESQGTQYTQLGWNYDAYGNHVYVLGNRCIGGDKNATVSSDLREFEFQFEEEKWDEFLELFVEVWKCAPSEAQITLCFFFTGLIRSLYKDAGVPVDFVLYLVGEQQSRKTTLAKCTNNLYCRKGDMDFAVRTVEKTSIAVTEKLISEYKDMTLILDDVSITSDKKYRQMQEEVVEHVTRMIGNHTRKSHNCGNGVKDYLPNANVIITGEYLPHYSESTLSRMLILSINYPVESAWLTKFEKEPLMLSTVAYKFLIWVQENYEDIVTKIGRRFQAYRQRRLSEMGFQERIQEHGFIMQNTFYLLYEFLNINGYMGEAFQFQMRSTAAIQALLANQEMIMKNCALRATEFNYCDALVVLLYGDDKLEIADDENEYKKSDDGFMKGKGIICISTQKIRGIMMTYFGDASITVQEITRQLKRNHFLSMDSSGKATKKVRNERYLHIIKSAVKEYREYCYGKAQ